MTNLCYSTVSLCGTSLRLYQTVIVFVRLGTPNCHHQPCLSEVNAAENIPNITSQKTVAIMALFY